MILTADERQFLDVFLHEVTTAPFAGPATAALHRIGVEYSDIPHLAWAYEQDVPRISFELGHAATTSPPLPWNDRKAVLARDRDIQIIWEQHHVPMTSAGR